MSIVFRIVVCFVLLFAAGLYFLEDGLDKRAERQYLEAAEESMVDAAQLFAAMFESQVGEDGKLDTDLIRKTFANARSRRFSARIYNLVKTELNTNLYVTDRNGIVIYDSNNGALEGQDFLKMNDVKLTLAGQYGARSTRTNKADDSSSIMFVGAAIRSQGKIVGMVSVSKPQRSVFDFRDETRDRIRRTSFIFFCLVSTGAVITAVFFARPLRRLTEYAREVARGQRPALPRFSAPELRTLATAFEEMRDALEDRNYVENYVQTLTHEMKSPVAAIRGAAELLNEEMPAENRAKFLENISAESKRLQKIIDRLLALAAIESQKTLKDKGPVRLAEFVRAVTRQMQPAADARQIALQVEAAETPVLQGDAFLLETALTNLIQNAIEFSPQGGTVRVQLQNERNGTVSIVVEDEGSGIPDYALERVFERFYSLQHPSTGRKSSGLGLCFVREAAQLHGGTVRLENRSDRKGARATLVLPVDT